MSLLLAEKFIELSDQHTAMAKTYNDIADELSEAAALSHPAVTGEIPEEPKGLEGVDEKAAKNQAAADKKKAAAAKRRAAAKKKKEAEAAKTAEAEPAVDLDSLLANAQDLTRKYLAIGGPDAARAVLTKAGFAKCSEATGDAEGLQAIIDGFTAAIESEDLA